MKKILFGILFVCVFITVGHAYTVCGPRVRGMEYAATSVVKVGETFVGYWAVGASCAVTPDVNDVSQLCDTVVAGGEAICMNALGSNTTAPFDVMAGTSTNVGVWCWCRRTRVMRNNELADSIGPWMYMYNAQGLANCQNNCAQFCADNVANNTNGFRNPLMLLTAF